MECMPVTHLMPSMGLEMHPMRCFCAWDSQVAMPNTLSAHKGSAYKHSLRHPLTLMDGSSNRITRMPSKTCPVGLSRNGFSRVTVQQHMLSFPRGCTTCSLSPQVVPYILSPICSTISSLSPYSCASSLCSHGYPLFCSSACQLVYTFQSLPALLNPIQG